MSSEIDPTIIYSVQHLNVQMHHHGPARDLNKPMFWATPVLYSTPTTLALSASTVVVPRQAARGGQGGPSTTPRVDRDIYVTDTESLHRVRVSSSVRSTLLRASRHEQCSCAKMTTHPGHAHVAHCALPPGVSKRMIYLSCGAGHSH